MHKSYIYKQQKNKNSLIQFSKHNLSSTNFNFLSLGNGNLTGWLGAKASTTNSAYRRDESHSQGKEGNSNSVFR